MRESDAKFFRPLWLRLAITAGVAVWFVVETLLSHDQMWMAITGIAVVYCVWNFFLRFPKDAGATVPAAPLADETAPPDAKQP